MIEIFVNGKPLTLYSDTTINIEMNNALFASPDIEGDYTYSFELPVKGNEIALDFAHLPWRNRRYNVNCVMILGGILNIKGKMLLQKAGENSVTAVVVATPYPEGFGKRNLTKNSDDEIVIAHKLATHKNEWRQFLKDSMSPEADIKFAPFFNDDGYGSENEDFGNWNGHKVLATVNPVFTNGQGNLLQISYPMLARTECERFALKDDDEQSTQYWERNQLAMCPQIRLSRLLEIWCKNAGYRFRGNLGEDLNNTFIQSTRSLDGTSAQYEEETVEFVAHCNKLINQGSEEGVKMGKWYLVGESANTGYVEHGSALLNSGWWTIEVKASLGQPSDISDTLSTKWAQWVLLAGAFMLGGGSIPVPGADLTALIVAQLGSDYYEFSKAEIHFVIYKGNHTPAQLEDEAEGDVLKHLTFPAASGIDLDFATNILVTDSFAGIHLNFTTYVKTGGNRNNEDIRYALVDQGKIDRMRFRRRSGDPKPAGLNIWRKSFNIPEMCPEMTNSSLLKTCIDAFGLCYFPSKSKGEAEFVPYAAIRNAKAIDLTDYELLDETEITEPEKPSRTFKLKPLKEESYSEKLRLDDTDSELPEAIDNTGRSILMLSRNTLYKSVAAECADEAWKPDWEELSGNPDKLKVTGEDAGEENVEPTVAIPHQRWWLNDRKFGKEYQHAVADFTIGSDMYNPDERSSELILTQYRGQETIDHERQRIQGVAAWEAFTSVHEVMLPVYGRSFSLTAKGENSLGEKYIRPVLELKNHTQLSYKLRVPYAMMPVIDNLLRPQEENPQNQTRFIVIRNVRSIPQKITFQIDNDDISGTVLCQIESVRT